MLQNFITKKQFENVIPSEGQYTATIKGVSKVESNKKVIIEMELNETGQPIQVWLPYEKIGQQTESFFVQTMDAIGYQLLENLDVEQFGKAELAVDVVYFNTLLKDKEVSCYCVHSQSANGNTVYNFAFTEDSRVKAMLAMMS